MSDLEILQGTWKIVALEMDGNTMPSAMLDGAVIAVEGERFTTKGMGADYGGTITLGETASPKEIDLNWDQGPHAGKKALGIYEFVGERWKLCLTVTASERPTQFAAPKASGVALELLERV